MYWENFLFFQLRETLKRNKFQEKTILHIYIVDHWMSFCYLVSLYIILVLEIYKYAKGEFQN